MNHLKSTAPTRAALFLESWPAGKEYPKKFCKHCQKYATAVPNPIKTKDPRRHLMEESGNIWFGSYCPACWIQEHYDRYRSWIERWSIRKNKRIPWECGPGGCVHEEMERRRRTNNGN